VNDGSIHMGQLDRGGINFFSVRCLYASIFVARQHTDARY